VSPERFAGLIAFPFLEGVTFILISCCHNNEPS
jgi:hypothetical protein